MNTQKVFIIGAGGHVGASAAYAMALRRAAYEMQLPAVVTLWFARGITRILQQVIL